jgi:hypothetical protein
MEFMADEDAHFLEILPAQVHASTHPHKPNNLNLKKTRGFGPRANYADRATAACWESNAYFCG